jgi:heat shock protein beta
VSGTRFSLSKGSTIISQIFYLAEAGKSIDALAKSVFIEKLHARGYEVFLLNEPSDEFMIQNLRKWK